MSFESFRADFAARLLDSVPAEFLQPVLLCLDASASGYEFTTRCTDLIVSEGIPDCVRLYLASKSIQNLKQGTLRNYFACLRDFFIAVPRPLDQITAADVRLFLANYRAARNVCESTLEHRRIMLNSFFEWCVDEELLRKSPMRHVQPIRVPDPQRLPLSALDLEKVRDACASLHEKAMVDFLYSTAARVAEVCALEIRHVNFQEHTVQIEHGKGDKGRTTFLNPESEISLKAYLASRTDSCPSLFISPSGRYLQPMSKKSLENEISRIVSRCDLSVHVTPHIFRHTAASLALQRGMPIEQVQRFLGHAKIQTTLRYAKILDVEVKMNHQKFVA